MIIVLILMLILQFAYFVGQEERTTRTNQLLEQILYKMKKDEPFQKPESKDGCTFYFGNTETGEVNEEM